MKRTSPDAGITPTWPSPATTVALPRVAGAEFDELSAGAGGSVPGRPRNRFTLRTT
jgi:hypothetical protein